MEPASDNRNQCPFCHAADPQAVWLVKEPDDFQLRRCGSCQLVYTVPVLDSQQMLSHYGEPYYGRGNVRFNALFERLVSWFRNRRARKIQQFATSGRVLDVGCGRGHILACLKKRGWQVQGVELNEAAVRHARDVLGLEVTTGGFDAALFPENHFDVVIFWHVLEHVPDISEVLCGARRILKPSGLLVIAVPNIASWQARWAKYHWFHLDLPRHYAHFSTDWLKGRLEGIGLEVREVSHFSFEQNPYGWIQSVLNRCGLRKNLLYDLLKNASARSIKNPIWQHPIQSLFCVLGFFLLLLPAIFMLIPETIFRQGATIELYAVRSDSNREPRESDLGSHDRDV